MPNPNRPTFGEVIDETWGDLVADHVVRRYVNNTERDADLTGIPPADLQGQLIVIAPGANIPPMVQVHNGSGWMVVPRVQSVVGQVVVTTDAWGNWSAALPAGAKSEGAVANIAQESLNMTMARHLGNWPAGNNRVGFRAWTPAGGNPANNSIGVVYIATYTF